MALVGRIWKDEEMTRDPEDIIIDFWECSIRNDFSEFDWDEAFDSFWFRLRRIMIEHGYLGLDEYKEYVTDMFGDLEKSLPEWAGLNNGFVHLSKASIVDAILKSMIDAYKEANLHPDLIDLYERLSSRHVLSEKEKVALFDACIHAEHCTGSVWEDVDIEELREELEERSLRLAREALMI